MNAYEKAVSLGLTGTDEEIVMILRRLTAAPVAVPSLRTLLRESGLLINGRNGWTGTLASTNLPALDVLADALSDPNQKIIETNKQKWGPTFVNAVLGLVMASAITPAAGDAVLAMGGGVPYLNLTVPEFVQQREAAEAALAVEDRNQKWVEAFAAAVNKIGTINQAAGVAAVRALADEMEAA